MGTRNARPKGEAQDAPSPCTGLLDRGQQFGEVAERLTHSPGANGDAQRAPEGRGAGRAESMHWSLGSGATIWRGGRAVDPFARSEWGRATRARRARRRTRRVHALVSWIGGNNLERWQSG